MTARVLQFRIVIFEEEGKCIYRDKPKSIRNQAICCNG
jgi:hypothetical protein